MRADGGVQDRPRLHLDEVGDHQPEADAAQAEHRVLLAQRLDGAQQLLRLDVLRIVGGDAGRLHARHLDEHLGVVGQELVQRRVDQPDDDRQAVHRLEDAVEVALLELLELGHRLVEAAHRLRVLVD